MPKFYGTIGFVTTKEDPENPGIWIESTVEKHYCGDLVRNLRRLYTTSNTVNDSINISNEISIVADPYAQQNMYAMRYVVFNGAKWKIETIDVEYPRLRLSIGGLYNG